MIGHDDREALQEGLGESLSPTTETGPESSRTHSADELFEEEADVGDVHAAAVGG